MTSSQKRAEEITAPVDLINIMLGYDNFDSVNGHGAVPLVSTLFNSIKIQKLARLKELLTAIVNGNPEKVKAILEKDPSILLEKLEENDYITALSGQRCNHVTAYRTALAVEDTQMAAMIKDKLIEVAGIGAANTQYREQFPDRWEADEAKRWAPVLTMLDSLPDIIKNAKGDMSVSYFPEYSVTVKEGSNVAKALTQFRSQLTMLLNEIVTTGRHFNPHLLLKAYQIYGTQEDLANNCRGLRDLFYQQVIGTIQRSLPVNYVQAFCNGLDIITEELQNNIPQSRSLYIKSFGPEGNILTNFYPLSASSLGFNYGLHNQGFQCKAPLERAQFFEAYINQKHVDTNAYTCNPSEKAP